jgi:shikimate kinase
LTELFQQRDPLYRQVADIVVLSGKQSVHALMLQVVTEIEAFKRKNLSS